MGKRRKGWGGSRPKRKFDVKVGTRAQKVQPVKVYFDPSIVKPQAEDHAPR